MLTVPSLVCCAVVLIRALKFWACLCRTTTIVPTAKNGTTSQRRALLWSAPSTPAKIARLNGANVAARSLNEAVGAATRRRGRCAELGADRRAQNAARAEPQAEVRRGAACNMHAACSIAACNEGVRA